LLAALFGVGAAERLTLHGVEVREGEGFVATKDLPADAVVVSVPSSEALTAQACFGSGSTILKDVPPAVKTRWARSPALLTACVLDLEKRAPPQWKSYVSALLKTKSHVPLRDSLTANLNASLSGSQVLHELALTFKDVTRLHSELEEYAPSIADWDRLANAYAVVMAKDTGDLSEPALVPGLDSLPHGHANAAIRTRASNIEVRLTSALRRGQPVVISYGPQSRAAFYARYGIDDPTFETKIRVSLALVPTDPMYEQKKSRFPDHLVTAKKLYEDLQEYLPAEKRIALSSALSFPHTVTVPCNGKNMESALKFLRFAVAEEVPDCPGEPPVCPYLGVENEKRAKQRLQLALLETRKTFRSFAQPKVPAAAVQLLDYERACVDDLLAAAGAPPPPLVGLYSALAAVAALCAVGLWKTQRSLWRKDKDALLEAGVEH